MARNLLAVAVCAVLAPAGCTATAPSPASTAYSDDFAVFVASALADAEASDATDAQIALIKQVAASGEVPYELVEQALDATFACFDAAGIRYLVSAPTVQGGITYPQYSFESSEDSSLADACIHANSDFIEVLNMRQPAAIEASYSAFERAMPQIIDCLKDLGYTVDDDITVDELQDMIAMQADEIGTAEEPKAHRRLDCAVDAGIDGW